MAHAKTEYLWEQRRRVYHLQSKRYVSSCGRFWLRGANKHLMGGFVKLEGVPDNLCPDCAAKGAIV